MILNFVLLVLSFVALVKGADFFVLGAASIGRRMKISPLIIGLTIVSIGTSTPELAVSLVASIKGQNGIAVGNVVGSNLFNILVVLGASALVTPLFIKRELLVKDFPFMLVCTLALCLFCTDIWIDSYKLDGNKIIPQQFVLSRSEGAVLLIFLGIFFYYLIKDALSNPQEQQGLSEENKIDSKPLYLTIFFTIFGIGLIILGGNLAVSCATKIARFFKISEEVIGLTICAIGTSLPELVTSVVAAKRGENEIAIGNVVGSNIFNLLFILGLSVVISPIVLTTPVVIDLLILLAVCLISYLILLKGRMGRLAGGLFLLIYMGYMAYLFLR